MRHLTLSFTLPQAKHILKVLESFPSSTPLRHRGLVSMFSRSIARIEDDEAIKRALVKSGDL